MVQITLPTQFVLEPMYDEIKVTTNLQSLLHQCTKRLAGYNFMEVALFVHVKYNDR
jgi:hypothetical protein